MHKDILVIIMCKVDWNIGHRSCPEKMSSLGGPTLKKNNNNPSWISKWETPYKAITILYHQVYQ